MLHQPGFFAKLNQLINAGKLPAIALMDAFQRMFRNLFCLFNALMFNSLNDFLHMLQKINGSSQGAD